MTDLSEKDGKRNTEPFNTENVNKRLEEEKKQNGPPDNYTPLPPVKEYTEKNEKESAVMRLIQDVKTSREDIDRLNESVTYIAEKLPLFSDAIDKLSQSVNQLLQNNGQAPQGQTQNMLGELLQSDLGSKLLDRLLPNEQQGEPPLISQADIKNEMLSSYMDNLNTGKAINNFVKDALKKKVTREVVNSTLSELGKPDIHGPA